MEDKVGNTIPSPREIQALLGEIARLAERVERITILLTKEQRKSTIKFRIGGEAIVAKLSEIAMQHGVKLPGISIEGMNADLTLAKRLQPLSDALHALTQRVDDTILEAQSECWWAATAYYTALARTGAADPALQSALKDVVDFFAIGRRKKAAAPTT